MRPESTYTGLTVTRSTQLPVSYEDARRQLRLDDITEDKLYVQSLIYSVCEYIERVYGLALLTQTVVEKHSGFPSDDKAPMYVHLRPGASVESVIYLNNSNISTPLTGFGYAKTGEKLFITQPIGTSWPTEVAERPDAVTITYTAGFGATQGSIPANIRLAVMNLIGHFDANRENPVMEKTTAFDTLLSPHFHYLT